MCVCVYLDGAQCVALLRVVINHHNKVVSDVSLLVAAAFITLPVGHQGGDVEDSCTHTHTHRFLTF